MSGKFKVLLVYVYPVEGNFFGQANRFVNTYRSCKPGIDHDSVVILNGGTPPSQVSQYFVRNIPNLSFFLHDNTGWDIGGYRQLALKLPPSTPMFCLSTKAHFKRSGWLRRMVEAWEKHGAGLYGTLATYEVRPHFCTTGFMAPASLLAEYPKVHTKDERYAFEHGPDHIVTRALKKGMPVKLVTWDGEYDMKDWRKPPNVYSSGTQSNCLTFFNHSDSYERSNAQEKIRRKKLADTNSQ